MKTYEEIIKQYGKPLNVALALGIVTPEDSYRAKCNASSRVCMWSKQAVPKRWQEKLAEIDQSNEK